MSCGIVKSAERGAERERKELETLQTELETLQTELAHLQQEIDEFRKEGYHEDELQDHITKLHEYNEIKDVGQMVLGRIADMEGVTTKDLYERYGLSLDD